MLSARQHIKTEYVGNGHLENFQRKANLVMSVSFFCHHNITKTLHFIDFIDSKILPIIRSTISADN